MNDVLATIDHVSGSTLEPPLSTGLLTLGSLVTRLLQHLVDRNPQSAAADLDLISQLRGKFPNRKLLRDLIDGTYLLEQRNGIHYLNAIPSAQFACDLEDAIAECSKFLKMQPPAILVKCVDFLGGIFLAQRDFPGFAVITISTTSPRFPDKLRATLFHEVAHAFLTSGQVFLDEGLATLFAERFSGDQERFPPSVGAMPLQQSIRQLLLAQSSDGLFFEGSGVATEQTEAVRRLAASFVDQLLGRMGTTGLCQLFDAVAELDSPAQVPNLVEQLSGMRLDTWGSTETPSQAVETLIESADQIICTAWQTRNADDIEPLLTQLRLQPQNLNVCKTMAAALLAQARLRVGEGGNLSPAVVQEIDGLLPLLVEKGLPAAYLWKLRGHRESLQILLVKPNLVKVALAGQKAAHAYKKSHALDPKDSDLLINMGILELHTPEQFGGNRAKGLDLIRQAAGPSIFGEHAKHVLARYEHTDQPGVPARPQTGISETLRHKLVEVSDLEVTFKGFSLLVDKLTLEPGKQTMLVGPNGAGKTVLLEALLGLRKRLRGKIELCGRPIEAFSSERSLRRSIGAQLQDVQMIANIKVAEITGLHRKLYGHVDPLVADKLHIGELHTQPYRQLSRGQKQRVQLYLALAHVPAVAVLDEPTLGLDEWHARSVRELWQRRRELGLGQIIISHVPADLASADHVVCLAQGRVTDQGPLHTLLARHVGQFRAALPADLAQPLRDEVAHLEGLLRPPTVSGDKLVLLGNEGFDAAFRIFIEHHALKFFRLESSTAEDFLAYISEKK